MITRNYIVNNPSYISGQSFAYGYPTPTTNIGSGAGSMVDGVGIRASRTSWSDNLNKDCYFIVFSVPRNLEGYDDSESPFNSATCREILSNPSNYTKALIIGSPDVLNRQTYTQASDNEFALFIVYGEAIINAISQKLDLVKVENNCTFTVAQTPNSEAPVEIINGKIGVLYKTVITATANPGYKFTGASDIVISHPYFGTPSVSLSENDTVMTATLYAVWYANAKPYSLMNGWMLSGNLTFTVTAEPQITSGNLLVVESSENCVVSGVPDSGIVNTGTSVTILAIANEGYYFNGRPYIRYTGTDGTEHKLFMTRLSNDTRATVTQVFSEIAQNLTTAYIVCNAVEIPKKTWPVVVKTATNCTVDAPDTYTEGETLNITATPNDGYRFDTVPTLQYPVAGGQTAKLSFTVQDNGTATFSRVVKGLPDGVTLSVVASAVEIPDKTYPIVTQTVNCTVTGVPAGNVYTEGETLNLVLTANEDYYFDVPPQVKFTGQGGVGAKMDFTIDPANDARATFNKALPTLADSSNVTIYAVAAAKTVYTDKYGSINVYNVTIDNLTQFAEERFINVEGESSVQEVDLGDYVSKLFRLYCDIGETTESTLKVGNFNLSNITVQVPINDTFTVDCGTLTVNGKNGTANDFNGELQIMLPFIGFQTINIDKALNNPLHLYYKINLVTGESVAILEINSIPAYYWDCKACQEILYLSHVQENFSNYEFTSKFLYGFVPFIVYKYNTDFNTSPVNSDAVREKVLNCVGYFEMTETTPFNAPNMNETERAKIIELLNSGVFYGAEFE